MHRCGSDDDVDRRPLDGLGRADIDALVAARLLRPAVGANRRLVLENFGFSNSPTAAIRSASASAASARVRTGVPVTLRRLMHGEVRHVVEIEHEIEVLAARLPAAVEIDGADRTAGHTHWR
jgi:hypothetical protein